MIDRYGRRRMILWCMAAIPVCSIGAAVSTRLIWFAVFYFGACAVTGAIVGGMAANRTKGDPSAVAAREASKAVIPLRGYFAIGAIALASVAVFYRLPAEAGAELSGR